MCYSKIPVTSLHAQRPHNVSSGSDSDVDCAGSSSRSSKGDSDSDSAAHLRSSLCEDNVHWLCKAKAVARREEGERESGEMRQNEIGEIHDMLMMTSMTHTDTCTRNAITSVVYTHTHTHTLTLISPTLIEATVLPKIAKKQKKSSNNNVRAGASKQSRQAREQAGREQAGRAAGRQESRQRGAAH